MSGRYSIRGLLLVILMVALTVGWFSTSKENQSLKARLVELKRLHQLLEIESNRLLSHESELKHYSALADAKVEQFAAILNAQRRKSAASLRVAEIRYEIESMLDSDSVWDLSRRKRDLLTKDVAESRRLLKDLESDPLHFTEQVAQAKQQLSYFEAQVSAVSQ